MNEHIIRWRMHAKSLSYQRHLSEAVEWIREAQQVGTFAVSWSGGKDSTALVHLVRSVDPTTPIIIQFDDCDWPQKRTYCEAVAADQGWTFHAVEPPFSVWDHVSQRTIGTEAFCDQSNWLTREGFLRLLDAKREELGCVGAFLGLRASESRGRGMNYATRGALYRKRNGCWVCNPLSKWSALDVFAYHNRFNLRINPVYLASKEPEETRLSWAIPTPHSLQRGAMEELRRQFPSQFRKLRNLGVQS